MRTWVSDDPAAATNAVHFSKTETDKIYTHFKTHRMNWRRKQLHKDKEYYNSCTKSRMRTDTGHSFVASAIWEIGFPCVPLNGCATEQQRAEIWTTDMAVVSDAIQKVLAWLSAHVTACVHAQGYPSLKHGVYTRILECKPPYTSLWSLYTSPCTHLQPIYKHPTTILINTQKCSETGL